MRNGGATHKNMEAPQRFETSGFLVSTHHLNDADFLREQNMTGTDVMNALEDIILHGIEK